MERSSKKRKWLLNLFKGFSLTAVAFAFQACYGQPRDFGMDKEVQGIITDTEGIPIQGITISLDDSIQYATTDQEGRFYFFLPRRHEYKLKIEDSTENSMYTKIDTIIKDELADLVLNVELKKK